MHNSPEGYFTQDVRGQPREYRIKRPSAKIRMDHQLHLVDKRPEWQKLRDRKGHSRVQKRS